MCLIIPVGSLGLAYLRHRIVQAGVLINAAARVISATSPKGIGEAAWRRFARFVSTPTRAIERALHNAVAIFSFICKRNEMSCACDALAFEV